MSQEFHATYEHGVLRLDAPLALPEQARVTGVVSNVDMPATSSVAPDSMSLDEFERRFDELAIDVPPLPPDFSRSDVYLDHD